MLARPYLTVLLVVIVVARYCRQVALCDHDAKVMTTLTNSKLYIYIITYTICSYSYLLLSTYSRLFPLEGVTGLSGLDGARARTDGQQRVVGQPSERELVFNACANGHILAERAMEGLLV